MRPRRSWRAGWHLAGGSLALAAETGNTATMTLKNAAFLAMIGMLPLTILVAADFIRTTSGVLGSFVTVLALLRSLIYLFASITVTAFIYVFNRAQNR